MKEVMTTSLKRQKNRILERKKKKRDSPDVFYLSIHQLACSNGRSHVRRSHFFVFTQPCEKLLSVTASATRVCVCA